MPAASCESEAEATRNISPLWIVLYLSLHQFVAQTIFGNHVFLYLRIAFLTLLAVVLLVKGETAQLRGIFIGRWLHRRKDWVTALVFISLVFALRVMVSCWFQFAPGPLNPEAFIMEAIVPPLNEEIVFRGLFLGALLACAPRQPWAAVVLSTAIFVSCHNLVGSHPAFWIALTLSSLLYGACYIRTRCVPLCIYCHGLWNSLLWFLPASVFTGLLNSK